MLKRAPRPTVRRAIALLLIVFSIPCLVRLFLPASLQSADTFHLVRVLIDLQRFPVEETYDAHDANHPIPIYVDWNSPSRQSWRRNEKNSTLTGGDIKQEFQEKSFDFHSVMSTKERELLLVTFEAFIRACEWASLTYFLTEGSLLGAYRHQGIIPWDDDIDVVMNASDWMKIRHTLSRIPEFELFAPSDVQWKFYMKNLEYVPNKPFKWPHIDIFFFSEDSTHVWGLTWGIKASLFLRKEDMFPLQHRPFETFHAAVPCNMENAVLTEFNVDVCVTPSYNHKASDYVSSSGVKKLPCRYLHGIFPFVFRQNHKEKKQIVEVLKVGDTVLRNETLPTFC